MAPRRARYILLGLVVAFGVIIFFRHEAIRDKWEALPPLPITDFKQFGESLFQQELDSFKVAENGKITAISSTSFLPGTPNASVNYTRVIVVPKMKKEDTSWLDEEFPDPLKAIYVVDDRKTPLHPPKNKGNEAMVYLSYIIDHYDNLADINIFIHAHRWAWHNNDLFNTDTAMTIRHLSDARVIREGYMNLRCMFYPGCPAWLRLNANEEVEEKKEELLVGKAWKELFPNDPMPDILGQPCCSQFALSADRIRAIPLNEYKRLRSWLLKTKLRNSMSGRVFEYLWHYLWTGKNVLCPAMHECYCDGFGACFKDENEFQQWFKVRFEVKQDEWEMNAWQLAEERYEEYVKRGNLKAAALVKRPPEGKLKELKLSIDERWFMLDEGREAALKNGLDLEWRARVRNREWKEGDGF
jgi:hypothetical protein